ncbi:hypothetical protein RchiOBHm_Chr5g0067541 [Rosa chinensis]|uniref:Uncharacterized protein n=1 Tax=Rosa chinensis TaxID=74649 RepID=A0A2P6QJG8_ROSCH|nr:hypothetical protein RchiOBHm_Chr5g0067541 [Rosa chinensis]
MVEFWAVPERSLINLFYFIYILFHTTVITSGKFYSTGVSHTGRFVNICDRWIGNISKGHGYSKQANLLRRYPVSPSLSVRHRASSVGPPCAALLRFAVLPRLSLSLCATLPQSPSVPPRPSTPLLLQSSSTSLLDRRGVDSPFYTRR